MKKLNRELMLKNEKLREKLVSHEAMYSQSQDDIKELKQAYWEVRWKYRLMEKDVGPIHNFLEED